MQERQGWQEYVCGVYEGSFLRAWRKSVSPYLSQLCSRKQAFRPPYAFPKDRMRGNEFQLQQERFKSRDQDELWFCYNYISSKARTRGCADVPLELLKEQDKLLPMFTLNRKWWQRKQLCVRNFLCSMERGLAIKIWGPNISHQLPLCRPTFGMVADPYKREGCPPFQFLWGCS